MRPVIYYRNYDMSAAEKVAAIEVFGESCVFDSRMKASAGDLVIARYSALPFYKELSEDLASKGAVLINTLHQHNFIADLTRWYSVLFELTPKTWYKLDSLPEKGGPYILKGVTNSKKQLWHTHMFAIDKTAAIRVHSRLCEDGLIGDQQIIIRQYVPLVTYGHGIGGVPITKEFRFFVVCGKIMCGGFYWSSNIDQVPEVPLVSEVPLNFLKKVVYRIGNSANFYSLDVAQTASGDWIVIEINDGQMSGLSENQPLEFYRALKANINENIVESVLIE